MGVGDSNNNPSTIDFTQLFVYARIMTKTIEETHASQAVALENPVATSQSVLPYYTDDTKKTKYLSFRATGFTPTEARDLTPCDKRTVQRWREADSEFKRLEGVDIAELRQTHGAAYHSAEFQRNLRSFMELDRRIIARAHAVLNDGMELSAMDTAEQGYLKTIRPLYSPAGLSAMMKAVNGDGDSSVKFDFAQLVQEMGDVRTSFSRGRVILNGQETVFSDSALEGLSES